LVGRASARPESLRQSGTRSSCCDTFLGSITPRSSQETGSHPTRSRSRFLQLIDAPRVAPPLQHLTGKQGFWRHEFEVTPDVLIPRPETELAVQASLELISELRNPVIAMWERAAVASPSPWLSNGRMR